MAYGTANKPAYGARPAAVAGTAKREFVDDPNEVGIGYGKTTSTGDEYVSIKLTKDIVAGTSLALFLNNKVKNRTDKTPTHKLKIAKSKAK